MTDQMNKIMYCMDCRYPLRGLGHGECPECGRRFDPDDPASYTASPSKLRGNLLVATICGLGVAAFLFYFLHVLELQYMSWALSASDWDVPALTTGARDGTRWYYTDSEWWKLDLWLLLNVLFAACSLLAGLVVGRRIYYGPGNKKSA